MTETQAAAQALGLQLHVLGGAESENELAQAFAAMTSEHADALVVIPSGLFFSHRRQLAELAMQHRLPAMFLEQEPVEAGGLIAYGPSMSDLSRRAAIYVHKILHGAKPADLPVEQPTQVRVGYQPQDRPGARPDPYPPNLLVLADEVLK